MTYLAVTEAMNEREQADFDARLLAKGNRARPTEGVEQLWGLMGRPGVAPGAQPGRPPAAGPTRRAPRPGRGIGETP